MPARKTATGKITRTPTKRSTTPATKTPRKSSAPRKSPVARKKAIATPKPKRRTAAEAAVPQAPSAPRKSTVKALAASKRVEIGLRQAIFIDVENTSSEEAIFAALESLGFDKVRAGTNLVAVGNWRVIGAHVGRMLASRGARLVHTAPATGVKDWSDLSIAVAAGIWLGRAKPGDSIRIVSADRAFDAVGDAATAIGIEFQRVSYASPTRAAAGSTAVASTSASPRRRSRRGGRRRRRPDGNDGGTGNGTTSTPAAEETSATEPIPPTGSPSRQAPPPIEENAAPIPPADSEVKDIRAAPPEKVVELISRLTAEKPGRGVNLDLLIHALKQEGFGRPPGSPRLVTRLRLMHDVEVSPTGMVRLVGAPLPVSTPAVRQEAGSPEAGGATEGAGATEAPAKRPRRRTGRGRRRPQSGGEETKSAGPPGESAEG